MKILLLSRAFRNFGDFLIVDRAEKLIKHHINNSEVIVGKSYIELEKQFTEAELNNIDAIIVPGGPGIKSNIYPDVYKIISDKPIYFLGIGASIHYRNILSNNFSIKLSRQSVKYMEEINKFGPIGVRDYISKKVLDENNIKSNMNACPALYDIQCIDKEYSPPKIINNVIFSVPVGMVNVKPFMQIVLRVKDKYDLKNIGISFNHGFYEDRMNSVMYQTNKLIREFAKKQNINIIDMSRSVENESIYEEFDLHIGYRVHSHIYFISKRKTSILVAEDSRGLGVTDIVPTPFVKSWETINLFNSIPKLIDIRFISKTMDDISLKITNIIDNEINSNFTRFKGIGKQIDSYYSNNMSKFINDNIQ